MALGDCHGTVLRLEKYGGWGCRGQGPCWVGPEPSRGWESATSLGSQGSAPCPLGAGPRLAKKLRINPERPACGRAPFPAPLPTLPTALSGDSHPGRGEVPANWSSVSLRAVGRGGGADWSVPEGGERNECPPPGPPLSGKVRTQGQSQLPSCYSRSLTRRSCASVSAPTRGMMIARVLPDCLVPAVTGEAIGCHSHAQGLALMPKGWEGLLSPDRQ